VPPVHVTIPEATATPLSPVAHRTLSVCKPSSAAGEAANAAAEKDAATVALAQLLSRCTESAHTRALTNRVIEVGLCVAWYVGVCAQGCTFVVLKDRYEGIELWRSGAVLSHLWHPCDVRSTRGPPAADPLDGN